MEILRNNKSKIVLITVIIVIFVYIYNSLFKVNVDEVYMISSEGLYSYKDLAVNEFKKRPDSSYFGNSLNYTDKGNIFCALEDGDIFFFELHNSKTDEVTTIRCDDILLKLFEELGLDAESNYFGPSICYFKEETQDIYFSLKTREQTMRIIRLNLTTKSYRYTRDIPFYGDVEHNPMYFGVDEGGDVIYGDIDNKNLYRYNYQNDKEELMKYNAKDAITSRDGKKLFYADYKGNAFVYDGKTTYRLDRMQDGFREKNDIIGFISFSDKSNYICVTNYKKINDYGFKPIYTYQVYMIDYKNNKKINIYSDKTIYFDGALVRE